MKSYQTINEIKILRWAAGMGLDIPELQDVDEQNLFELLGQHRLVQRFLYRFLVEHPDWCSKILRGFPAWCAPSLLDRLLKTQSEHRAWMSTHIEAINELMAFAHDLMPIAVKGFSRFVATGDPRAAHASGDVDLLAAEPEDLVANMVRVGYVIEEAHASGSHAAILVRGQVRVEVHRFLPIWSYPTGMIGVSMYAPLNCGIWTQPYGDIHTTEVKHSDLVNESTLGIVAGTGELRVPGPTMTALLLCAHVFRHYVEGIPRAVPVVRLGELADIRDSIRCEHFEPQRFRDLVDQFSAHDAILFVRHLFRVFLEEDPLGWLTSDVEIPSDSIGNRNPFPALLSAWSGWAVLLSSEELLHRLDPREMFERLNPNPIEACQTKPIWYFGAGHDCEGVKARTLPRIIIQSPTFQRLPIALASFWQDQTLRIDITIPRRLPCGSRYQTLMYHPYNLEGDRAVGFETLFSNVLWAEVSHSQLEHTQSFANGGAALVRLTADGVEAEFVWPWSALPSAFVDSAVVPMVVAVMRIKEDNSRENICFREDILEILPLHLFPSGSDSLSLSLNATRDNVRYQSIPQVAPET